MYLYSKISAKGFKIITKCYMFYKFLKSTVCSVNQGWEFAHLIFERITRFLSKNECMSDSLKKMSDSLSRSFLVSNLSNLLTIVHFLWATWANRSWSLIFGEWPEGFAHIAHFWWATWAIHSHRSPKKRKWAIRSFFRIFF